MEVQCIYLLMKGKLLKFYAEVLQSSFFLSQAQQTMTFYGQ